MLDIKFVRDNPEIVKENIKKKFQDEKLPLVDKVIELDRQIINYLNLIAYQDRLLKKVQKLKYLKDQLILDTNTNIRSMLDQTNPVWMEPRPKYTLKVSIPMLRNTDEGLRILQKVAAGKGNSRLKKCGNWKLRSSNFSVKKMVDRNRLNCLHFPILN